MSLCCDLSRYHGPKPPVPHRVRRPVYSRETGAPPLELQLRGQVRSSSGMTWGRHTEDGAKMTVLPGAAVVEITTAPDRPVSVIERLSVGERRDRLFLHLRALDKANAELPHMTELASLLGITRAGGTVIRSDLRALTAAGLIRVWFAPGRSNHVQMAIRVMDSDSVLRTAHAPRNLTL